MGHCAHGSPAPRLRVLPLRRSLSLTDISSLLPRRDRVRRRSRRRALWLRHFRLAVLHERLARCSRVLLLDAARTARQRRVRACTAILNEREKQRWVSEAQPATGMSKNWKIFDWHNRSSARRPVRSAAAAAAANAPIIRTIML